MASTTPPRNSIGIVATVPESMEATHETVSTSCVARVTSAAVPSEPNSSNESVLTLRNTSARRSAQKQATTSVDSRVPPRMLARLTAAMASICRQRTAMAGKSRAAMPPFRMADIHVGSSRSHSVDRAMSTVAASSFPRYGFRYRKICFIKLLSFLGNSDGILCGGCRVFSADPSVWKA